MGCGKNLQNNKVKIDILHWYKNYGKRSIMKKKILILIIITLFNIGCSKIRDDATMVLCTSLETNPNLCSKTISKNY